MAQLSRAEIQSLRSQLGRGYVIATEDGDKKLAKETLEELKKFDARHSVKKPEAVRKDTVMLNLVMEISKEGRIVFYGYDCEEREPLQFSAVAGLDDKIRIDFLGDVSGRAIIELLSTILGRLGYSLELVEKNDLVQSRSVFRIE